MPCCESFATTAARSCIVTHKLAEIMEIADRVTVMRDGQVVATRTIGSTSGQELTRLMVGRDVNCARINPIKNRARRFCKSKDLRVQDENGRKKFAA